MGEFVSRLIDAARGVSVDGAEELLRLLLLGLGLCGRRFPLTLTLT